MKSLNSEIHKSHSSLNLKATQNSNLGLFMKDTMPDIANAQKSNFQIPLDWVGMGEVETSIRYFTEGQNFYLPAKANVFVNLIDPSAKGIHMSRIYLLATKELESKSASAINIKSLLQSMVSSQGGRSSKAKINLHFELPIKRKALMSDLEGLRHYPVSLNCELNESGELVQIYELEVMYSSTCPCSAALARQLIKNKWMLDFNSKAQVSVEDVAAWLEKEESMVATPHAQRSRATVRLKIDKDVDFDFIKFIDLLEKTLKTPVQTAVKREDEQEFARLNGTHLMFCEDAAREIYSALNKEKDVQDFWLKVEHLESLHSHNAVSETSKFGSKI
jgi:GTP cyclohydrolase IB